MDIPEVFAEACQGRHPDRQKTVGASLPRDFRAFQAWGSRILGVSQAAFLVPLGASRGAAEVLSRLSWLLPHNSWLLLKTSVKLWSNSAIPANVVAAVRGAHKGLSNWLGVPCTFEVKCPRESWWGWASPAEAWWPIREAGSQLASYFYFSEATGSVTGFCCWRSPGCGELWWCSGRWDSC